MFFAAAMDDVGSVPYSFSIGAFVAADSYGVDPVVIGAYLISEHGDDWTDNIRCSSAGACGPYQLVALWPRHFGYSIEDRDDPIRSAEIAAQLIHYSIERHTEKCGSQRHDWRAHLKSGSRGRNSVSGPVRRWKRYEDQLRERIEHYSNN